MTEDEPLDEAETPPKTSTVAAEKRVDVVEPINKAVAVELPRWIDEYLSDKYEESQMSYF